LTVAIDLLKMGITVTDFHRLFCRFDFLIIRLEWMLPFRFVAVWTVAVLTCLKWMSPLWFVAVSVCRRSGLSPFLPVAVSVRLNGCRRYGLSPFRFVAVSACRRFDCTPTSNATQTTQIIDTRRPTYYDRPSTLRHAQRYDRQVGRSSWITTRHERCRPLRQVRLVWSNCIEVV